ncbi:NAD(P)/FAD-dependent oxidoreductase [uncultured Bacteroides sp.]|uniref:NAD(P)/FAD-dependent oxidoreductase n=1 Tax=uncultured Bacteroides sp. TaxID=162156 RepID=UPI002AA5F449|nr:NAD(P)/FAD-dependent oxidoreductase [uncultured Bacteroides sp.]
MKILVPDSDKKRIIIVGGGFGGLALADKLCNGIFQVVLIDRHNYHQFQPLLYQVASAGLEPSAISFPFRKNFRKKKEFYFRMTEVTKINSDKHSIETPIGSLDYDYLVIAAGTTTNFFGNEVIKKVALPMKSVEEAINLRNTLLINLEKALDSHDSQKRRSLLNIVIVGGGATGVEIAGALSEMKRYILPEDYPDLKDEEMNIYLIEGSDRLLAVMSEEASAHALRFLTDMGITVILNKHAIDYRDGNVILSDGESLLTNTLIWVSGVIAERFDNISPELMGHGGRLLVNEFNQLQGYRDIFAIGDICLQTEATYPKGHPQVAPVAIQQGELLAENLKRMEQGELLKPFMYKDKGTLATVGRNKAVADIKKIRLQGFLAWAVWLLVHLRSILGVKNKLMVLFNWIWNYVMYDQSVRFIFRSNPKH